MGISASGPLGSPVNITLPISFSNTNYCVASIKQRVPSSARSLE
ncbi:hypothetical protein [Escherichia coli]